MSDPKPFLSENFKKFVLELKDQGAQVCCAVKYHSTGVVTTVGDSDMGITAFTARKNEQRRNSKDWVPAKEGFVKLKKPLSQFYMKQALVVGEAASIVKKFIGRDTMYGEGQCFLWDYEVPVSSLTVSRKVLEKYKWDSQMIRLSNVVSWTDFKIKSFGVKPPAHLFKINMSWREYCVLIIEIGYQAIKIDPETFEEVHEHEKEIMRSEVGVGEENDVLSEEEEIPKLDPVLLQMKHGIRLPSPPKLQIIQIFPSNIFKTKYSLRLSDGLYWVETKLDTEQSKLITDGVLKKYDLIILKEYTGNLMDASFNIIREGSK